MFYHYKKSILWLSRVNQDFCAAIYCEELASRLISKSRVFSVRITIFRLSLSQKKPFGFQILDLSLQNGHSG